ncbi:hypothetical protein AaE_002988 [Aphanomyces astaci]|uniref:Cysteine dioxygenase n=1 Tax=Aphanomyces astaci TaxID=112090 RepID=A0A6A5AV11_APHAT|nr:hypothetical protein AaE_002988 [Aphanomyces astaci]
MIVQDAPRPRDEHHTVKTTKSAQQAKPPPLPRKVLTLQELVEVIDMETQLKEGYFLASSTIKSPENPERDNSRKTPVQSFWTIHCKNEHSDSQGPCASHLRRDPTPRWYHHAGDEGRHPPCPGRLRRQHERPQPFVHFDRTRNYTRNLVATDNVSYSLIVLCWNKGKYSPIHDHPSDGCWIRHIQGIVNEVRYESDGEALVESANILISHGMTYMDDSLGLHKVGNPSEDVDAITLHLYAPPFYQCRLWHDPQDATNATIGHCRYDSEYGDY